LSTNLTKEGETKWTEKKMILPDAPFELYNLADDPNEKVDLAENRPERVADMKKLLLELIDKGRTR